MTAAEFAESQRLQARWASATPIEQLQFVAESIRPGARPAIRPVPPVSRVMDKVVDGVWCGLFWVACIGLIALLPAHIVLALLFMFLFLR